MANVGPWDRLVDLLSVSRRARAHRHATMLLSIEFIGSAWLAGVRAHTRSIINQYNIILVTAQSGNILLLTLQYACHALTSLHFLEPV